MSSIEKIDISAEAVGRLADAMDNMLATRFGIPRSTLEAQTLRALSARLAEVEADRDARIPAEHVTDMVANAAPILAQALDATGANLAKAVTTLRRIADDCEADYPPSHGAIKHDARATLAEIGGAA